MANLYDPHPMMIDSGTFWRCDHGNTGIGPGMKWIGCKECAVSNPQGRARFEPGAVEYESWSFAPERKGDRG